MTKKLIRNVLNVFTMVMMVAATFAPIMPSYSHNDGVSLQPSHAYGIEFYSTTCAFDDADYDYVVDFPEDARLRGNGVTIIDPVSVNMPAGDYEVSLHAYDGYDSRASSTGQENEKYFVRLMHNNSVTATSSTTPDLQDGTNEATWSGIVNNSLTTNQNVTGIVAVHASHINSDYADSVKPVCAAFNRVNDNQPPVIKVNPKKITILQGTTLTDADLRNGVTANDPEDGNITADIVVDDSNVNTNVLGDFKVYYNVQDSEGLAANQKSRTYTVEATTECSDGKDNDGDGDTDYPYDSGCDSPEDDSENTPPVITVDPEEVILTVGTILTLPELFDGVTAVDEEDGDISNDVAVSGNVDTTTIGTYTVAYNVDDSEGLAADEKTRTYKIVANPPECSDGKDNDDDGHVDYPADPGCDDPEDDDESDEPILCSYDVYSDVKNSVIGAGGAGFAAVAAWDGHANWTADIPDATWIWSSEFVVDPSVSDTQSFTRTFAVTGDITSAGVVVAADDAYTVYVNGTEIGGDDATSSPANFSAGGEDFYDITDAVVSGVNFISFRVTNNAFATNDPKVNPTGLLYHLMVASEIESATDTSACMIDNTKPVITLADPNPVTLIAGDTYTEPGYAANDAEDGDITADVVVDHSDLQLNTPGSYDITYNVRDSQNLAADEKIRVVDVLPGTPEGRLNVCKIMVDADGNVINTPGTTEHFTVTIYDNINPSVANVVSHVNFETPLTLTDDFLFNDGTNDAYCVTLTDLDIDDYVYSMENAHSGNAASWQTPLYNDQHDVTIEDLDDFFPYSDELFDDIPENDDSRDVNADGHIVLSNDRPERTVVVLNRLATTTECNDGLDNDNDGDIDYPADEGCDGPEDPSENQPPVITVDPEVITIDINTVLTTTDLLTGVTADDAEDGDITGDVVPSGVVNTGVLGPHVVTYNVVDSEGLAADQKTRTYIVTSQCSDDIDNDNDNMIDYDGHIIGDMAFRPDTGCDSPEDNDENTPPVITVAQPAETIFVGESFDPDTGVTADDEEDGNITNDIVTTDNDGFTNTIPGTYTFTYNVTDSHGAPAEPKTKTVVVQSNGGGNTKPTIIVDPETITVLQGATAPNVLDGVTATDAEDDDTTLTAAIVATGSVDTSTLGNYTITYNVTDSGGLAADPKNRIYTVVEVTECNDGIDNDEDGDTDYPADEGCDSPEDPSENQPPVITVDPEVITIDLGSNDPNVLDGVTANDPEDGDITGDIVPSGTVDTNVPGDYIITYNVDDSEGEAAPEKTRTYKVIHDPEGNAPIITVDPTSVTIRVRAGYDILNGVRATDVEDDDDILTGQIVVSGDTFNPNNPGTYTILYNVTDSDGNPAIQKQRVIEVDDGGGACYGHCYNTNPSNAAPTITLDDPNPLQLVVGDTYEEPGYTANDPEDGNITNKVIVDQSGLDTSRVGTYQIRYNVTDSQGARAVEKVRTVVVGAVIGIPPVYPNCNLRFTTYMRRGMRGGEIADLQRFLNHEVSHNLVIDGVFGPKTEAAVHAYQDKYAQYILDPWTNAYTGQSTGYFYKTSRYWANLLNGCLEDPVFLEDVNFQHAITDGGTLSIFQGLHNALNTN